MRCEIDAEPKLLIHGSRELIGQAIANLVDNALKYGGARGPRRRKEPRRGRGSQRRPVGASQRRGDRNQRRRPWRGHRRGRSRARARPLRAAREFALAAGSGLGLSLAAAVARLHNGALRLEDNAPGLRVVIALPALALTREAAPQLLLAAARGRGVTGRSRPRGGGRGVRRSAGASARPRASPIRARRARGSTSSRLGEAAELRPLAAEPRVKPLLEALADHSPFLWRLASGDPDEARALPFERPAGAP